MSDWPQSPCCMGDEKFCACLPMERSMRGWQSGAITAPMSAEQRTSCLDEIGRVEGYDRDEHVNDTDRELAGNVLSAWTDYARDKGLL